MQVEPVHFHAVIADGPMFRGLKAQQEFYQSGFSAAALSDYRNIFSRIYAHAEILQDWRIPLRITESNVTDPDISA